MMARTPTLVAHPNLKPIFAGEAERRGAIKLAGPYAASESDLLERAAMRLARGGIAHAVVRVAGGLELWRAKSLADALTRDWLHFAAEHSEKLCVQ